MFFITQHKLRGLLCVALLFLSISIFAQFSLKADRTTANYDIGETAEFILNSSQSGTATYKLKYDNITPAIETGSIAVFANAPATIPFQGASAEVVLCEVSLNGVTKTSAAVFDSQNIDLFSEEPSDFDQFWDNQKNISASIPLDPQLTYHSNDGEVTNYRINLANVDNRRVYGYISIPNSGSNFPAIITLPPFSSAANTVSPQSFVANRAGVISATISVHNAEPDQVDPSAYEPNIINDRDNYYYRYAILGTLRMIDYLYTRSDFDGQNIGITGVSQGGGLALIAAGLDDRVKSLSISNPAMCRHAGYDQGKASGFPYYVQRSDFLENNATHYAQTLSASRYYDAAYFARRYMGPTLAIVSYADDITPAGTSFAALNELRANKIIAHARDLGHTHPSAYWEGRYNLWRHEFPATIQLPYHTNTGYWAEAGDDRTATTDTELDLSGQVFQNGVNNYSFPVEWELIEGPDDVTFSNENVANPSVEFDTPGRYLLRFTAYDYGSLMNEGIFHEISDFMYVDVEGNGQQADTSLPTCQLTFAGFNPGGSLRISATFSEPVIGLTADDFQVTNGTVESIVGGGANYTLDVFPLVVGNVRISLPFGQATDTAGNLNLPSNQVSIFISSPPPPPGGGCDNVFSGGEISGDESRCEAFNPSTITSNSSPVGGTGTLEYQWQSAPSLSGNWTNIPNANSVTFNPTFLSTTSYFRRLARRAGCDDYEGISNAIVKEIIENEEPVSNAPTGYCAMQGDNPNNFFIRKIELENLSHESSREGYADFTSESATLAPGSVYIAHLTPGNESVTNNWVGWIDYNRDGDFNDERELIIFKSDNTTVNAFFEVPANVELGATRMRIALRGNSFPAPCYSYAEGEVEDYTIILGSEAGSGGGPTTNPSPTNPNPTPTYCEARGTEPWWQWISRVQFADLDHSSFKERYGDFTDRFANVEAGNTYELSLTPDFSWLIFDMNWKVWIDFNQDGDFEDTGELVADGISGSEISFDVQIPSSAPTGTTGMRVASNVDEIPDACTNIVRGEFEDYSIVVSGNDCGNGNNRFSPILDLVAQPYAREVELHWTTNTEYKNKNFIIEHSLDGVNFVELGQQESLTDGYLPNVYRIKHENPPLGENIYRVKQIYNNGSHVYSEAKKVLFTLDLEAFIPYPNPSSQKLYLPLQKYAGQTAHVKIYNNFAQLLRTSVVNSLSIEPEEIDVSDLQDGIYYISIEIAGQRTISRAFTVFRI
jgi:cephalosporin-C deacetylase-like acetyl esterase